MSNRASLSIHHYLYSIVYSKIPAKFKIFCQNRIAHKDRLHMFFVLFSELFISVSQDCVAVLCCRMSPLQKAQVRVAFNLKIFYIAEAERRLYSHNPLRSDCSRSVCGTCGGIT